VEYIVNCKDFDTPLFNFLDAKFLALRKDDKKGEVKVNRRRIP
jgi:hypothetical protein